jgi:hypothetical protein
MITRKDFLKLSAMAALPVGVPLLAASAAAEIPAAPSSPGDSRALKLTSEQFALSLTAGNGLQCRLVHVPTGTLLADGPYSYSLGPIAFTGMKQEESSVTLQGTTATGITIEQRFTADPKTSWVEEDISLTNTRSHPLVTSFRCGLVLPVRADTLKDYTFTAVPYRREPPGDRKQYADYSLDQILYERRRSKLRGDPQFDNTISRQAMHRVFTEDYLSEGWAFTDKKSGFLVTKYNQTAREFSILDRVPLSGDQLGLRWGGAGAFDDAEGCYHLAPGATHYFGITRLTAFQGDFVQGYYAFRSEMESRGHRITDSYDPPSHWNELYDNKLWWTGAHTDPILRKKFYSLPDIKQAAASAQEMGCEALYLDPGWDTPQSSKIWAEDRLGRLSDFLAMLKNDFGGLKLSLHTPLSSWTGPCASPTGPCVGEMDVIPGTAIVRDKGEATLFACGASAHYIEETVKRLKVLADAGVCFFMFDGTVWMGECWNTDHGHSLPSTAAEHVEGTNAVANKVHETNPDVLVEMHDQLFGGTGYRYVPSYYRQGPYAPGIRGWNEIWAFELMWSPMDDLVGGHSIALYYFNLAYSIPAYIHIDLRQDNAQCLMLWWSISTCRHLGVGGTHPDMAIRQKQKEVIATYHRLKPFFTTGLFYGIDEMTHVHIDRKKTGAVINTFNLEKNPVEREITFAPATYGLPGGKTYKWKDGTLTQNGDIYTAKVSIPGFGHTLFEIT